MGEEEMRILLLLFGASCADDSTVIHNTVAPEDRIDTVILAMDPTNEPCAPDTWTDKDGDGCAYWNVKYFQQGLTYGDCKNQNMVEKWLKDGFHPGFCEAMGCCDCTLSENCMAEKPTAHVPTVSPYHDVPCAPHHWTDDDYNNYNYNNYNNYDNNYDNNYNHDNFNHNYYKIREGSMRRGVGGTFVHFEGRQAIRMQKIPPPSGKTFWQRQKTQMRQRFSYRLLTRAEK